MTEKPPANRPKVSVVSITYNHEAYIRDTLEGFIAQKTNFPVEFIVADDASTDATPTIITEYAENYPDLIRPILRPENVGVHANAMNALSAACGEYLALCEGDDYWTDPLKLAKQATFLDAHPETAVCFHPVRVVWEDGGMKDSKFPPLLIRGKLRVETLCLGNFIQTNSVMYRKLARYDDFPAGIMPMDWYMHVRHAVCGEIAMLPETMAVYRRHSQGVWRDREANPAKFWLTHGPGHVAMFDAMLDLFPGQSIRQEIIAGMGDWILSCIAKVPGPEGRAVLQDTIARYPRLVMLALQHRWATPRHRLKVLRHKLAALAPSRRGLVDVWPARLSRSNGMESVAHRPSATGG